MRKPLSHPQSGLLQGARDPFKVGVSHCAYISLDFSGGACRSVHLSGDSLMLHVEHGPSWLTEVSHESLDQTHGPVLGAHTSNARQPTEKDTTSES